jgi:hypothetical protein
MDTAADTALGVSSGATMGFDENIGAAAAAPFSDQNYTQIRNAIRARKDLAALRSPTANTLGKVGGAAATAAATGLPGVAKYIPGALRLGAPARLAAEGALQGAGDTRAADPTAIASPGDYPVPVATGAASSMVLGGLLGVAGRRLGMGNAQQQAGEQVTAQRAADRARVAAAHLNPHVVESEVPPDVADSALAQARAEADAILQKRAQIAPPPPPRLSAKEELSQAMAARPAEPPPLRDPNAATVPDLPKPPAAPPPAPPDLTANKAQLEASQAPFPGGPGRQGGGVAAQAKAMREAQWADDHGQVHTGIGMGRLTSSAGLEDQAYRAKALVEHRRHALAQQAQALGAHVRGAEVASKLEALAKSSPGILSRDEAARGELAAVAARLRGADGKRVLSFAQANAERALLAKSFSHADVSPSAQVQQQVYRIMNDSMEEALNRAEAGVGGKGALGSRWRALGKQEAGIMRVLEGVSAKLGRGAMAQPMSASDKAAGAIGVLKSSAPIGAGMVAVNGALKNFGHSMKAASAESAAQRAGNYAGRSARVAAHPMGRALQHAVLATSNAIARTAAGYADRHVQADQGADAVQTAPDPDTAAREHFIQSQTNAPYRETIARPGEPK